MNVKQEILSSQGACPTSAACQAKDRQTGPPVALFDNNCFCRGSKGQRGRHRFQNAKGREEGEVKTADKQTKGESVQKLVDIPFQLITQMNMATFITMNQK